MTDLKQNFIWFEILNSLSTSSEKIIEFQLPNSEKFEHEKEAQKNAIRKCYVSNGGLQE
jgi:hypothetical protein